MYENIKIATIDDVELIKSMVTKFLATTMLKDHLDDEAVTKLIIGFLTADKNKNIVLLHGDSGMVAGISAPIMFVGPLMANEVGWWVEPDARSNGVGEELIDAFEWWAKGINCKLVTMSCLEDSLGKYFEKRGYTLYERSYVKEL